MYRKQGELVNADLIVAQVTASLRRRYGPALKVGRSRLLRFGPNLTCSINYSKLLRGDKYFFGLSRDVADANFAPAKTELGEFVLLVCGSAERVLVLPRDVVLTMLADVPTRRLDVFVENATYILQTTRHPKLDVTHFLNAWPKQVGPQPPTESDQEQDTDEPSHVRMQWSLVQLGRAEGCSVWVPPADRNLSFQRQPLTRQTMERLPNFGFEEASRRIIQNIDVLWLRKNVILKAFEIESTTSIYSGLLRLNDLVLAQPNNQIDLYIVAGATRRARVLSQLLRPSFQPLIPRCQFLSFEAVDEQISQLRKLPVESGTRITGLVRGERFSVPEKAWFVPETT